MKPIVFIIALFLVGCGTPYKKGDPARYKVFEIDEIQDDLNYAGLVAAIDVTVEKMLASPDKRIRIGQLDYSYTEYIQALQSLRGALDSPVSTEAKQRYIIENFKGVQAITQRDWGKVFVTGYFTPEIQCRRRRSKKYSEPIYKVPKDMLKVDVRAFYEALPSLEKLAVHEQVRDGFFRGRIVQRTVEQGQRSYIEPYYSREQILSKNRLATIICYADPIDAFFLQIQGSGEAVLKSGRRIQLNYADQNGHRYYAIGKSLTHIIPLEEMSMQSIEAHLRSLPKEEAAKILNKNPSFVFFRKAKEVAQTAFGIEAQSGRSIATDIRFYPRGLLGLLSYPDPDDLKKTRTQLVFNHDAGGAIKGPGRIDLYWGKGPLAAALSGGLKGVGHLTFLVPKK